MSQILNPDHSNPKLNQMIEIQNPDKLRLIEAMNTLR